MIHSEYSTTTGLFTGRQLTGSPEQLEININPGCAVIAGPYSPATQKVDLATLTVIAI